mmetsp:Transcript_13211/g.18583  ORF Transcript_13211/g.18583 Transcript_13211/m.18583 type:complete len:130 (+) Transcript_13211:1-390(+)
MWLKIILLVYLISTGNGFQSALRNVRVDRMIRNHTLSKDSATVQKVSIEALKYENKFDEIERRLTRIGATINSLDKDIRKFKKSLRRVRFQEGLKFELQKISVIFIGTTLLVITNDIFEANKEALLKLF